MFLECCILSSSSFMFILGEGYWTRGVALGRGNSGMESQSWVARILARSSAESSLFTTDWGTMAWAKGILRSSFRRRVRKSILSFMMWWFRFQSKMFVEKRSTSSLTILSFILSSCSKMVLKWFLLMKPFSSSSHELSLQSKASIILSLSSQRPYLRTGETWFENGV